MFVLGLIVILVSAGALVAVLASGTDDHAALYGGSLQVPTLVVFLAGAAALLLFIIGLELVRSGVSRANKNRRNNRRLRKLERREQEQRTTSGESTDASPGATQEPARTSPTSEQSAPSGDTGRAGGPDPDAPTEAPPPPSR